MCMMLITIYNYKYMCNKWEWKKGQVNLTIFRGGLKNASFCSRYESVATVQFSLLLLLWNLHRWAF